MQCATPPNICCAMKGKGLVRCAYTSHSGSNLCGIHRRTKRVKLYTGEIIINGGNVGEPYKTPTKGDVLDLNQAYRLRFNTTRVRDLRETLSAYGKLTDNLKKATKKQLWDTFMNFYGKVFPYLTHTSLIRGLQKRVRHGFQQRATSLQGPFRDTLGKCVNHEDVLTLDSIIDIPSDRLFTYQESDGFTYAFDIGTIQSLVERKSDNPYTRKPFPEEVIQRATRLIGLLKAMGHRIQLEDDVEENVTPEMEMRRRVVKLFTEMDNLDQYTNTEWFMSLSVPSLMQLYKETEDIWNYRLNLTKEVKQAVVPPDGKVFQMTPNQVYQIKDKQRLREICLNFMEKLVYSAESRDDRINGCVYVLLGIVIVHPQAAEAMPAYYTMVTGDPVGANFLDVAV